MSVFGEAPGRIRHLLRLGLFLIFFFLLLFNLHTGLQLKSFKSQSEQMLNERLRLAIKKVATDMETSMPVLGRDPAPLARLRRELEVEQISLLDRQNRSLGDSYLHIEPGDSYTLSGIPASQLEPIWSAPYGVNGPILSSVYEDLLGRPVKAAFLPLTDSDSNVRGIIRVTVRLAPDAVTNLGDVTGLLLKIFGGVGVVVFLYYGLRSVVVSQRKQFGQEGLAGNGTETAEPGKTGTAGFVIDTFQSLIGRLKEKEQELERHRRVAEERADHIESYNENILRSVSSGVITFNQQELITTFNLAAERILGLSGPEVIGCSCSEVFGRESRIAQLVQGALLHKEVTFRQELELTRTASWVEKTSVHPASARLSDREGHESSSVVQEEVLKSSAFETASRQEGKEDENMLGRIPGAELAESNQIHHRREKIWVGVSTSLLMDRQNRVIGTTMIFTDISEIKRLQEQMELKKRLTMLGEMSAGIAHEFRNYMGTILGYAKLLSKKVDAGHAASGMIQAIIQELGSMGQLINELLGFSKNAELNLQSVDLRLLIERVVQQVFEQEKGPLPKLTLILSAELGQVQVDEVLMRQALGNLIKNALEAMPGGGELRVQAGLKSTSDEASLSGMKSGMPLPDRKDVVIEVQDTGEGIARDVQDKIFLPFFTTKEKGTGLGLALVHKIILSHNGQIQADSQEGRGTTFRVYLPVVS